MRLLYFIYSHFIFYALKFMSLKVSLIVFTIVNKANLSTCSLNFKNISKY